MNNNPLTPHLKYDLTILTDARYLDASIQKEYVQNIILEDQLVQKALEDLGLRVHRTNWDNPNFDWTSTKAILFRSTWDYHDRFEEFYQWLKKVNKKTQLINSMELIHWNIDKHYLKDLSAFGIHIPPTRFIEPGENTSLKELAAEYGWPRMILKPAISAAARHTYLLNQLHGQNNLEEHEAIFQQLINKESMLLQPFLESVMERGEISLMVFDGQYSHAILKKAKLGDFRVQDNFGGTIHDYEANEEEIAFALEVFHACRPDPVYARIDLIRDAENRLCLSELEIIEPELWFRKNKQAATLFSKAILKHL